VHWFWGGYRDCVDVNVQAATVQMPTIVNRYGIYNTSAALKFVKMEHCEFFNVWNPLTQCTLLPVTNMNAKPIMDVCIMYGRSCTAVQCARMNNPSTSLSWTPGIPYTWANATELYTGGRCGSVSIDARTKTGCKWYNSMCNETTLRGKSADFDDQVCFGFEPTRDQAAQTSEDYIITNDPLDPRWYSTCWLKVANGGFINTPPVTTPYPSWKAGDKCVTCAFRQQVQANNDYTVANWANGLTNTCVNCDEPDF
jgi:hypothetical protein